MAQSDQQIIEQVLRGESQLYAVLVSKYQDQLFNFMLRLCFVKQDAEDLTQDAFVKAYENIEKFQVQRSFLNWLYAIALNLYRDSARRKKVRAAKMELYVGDLIDEYSVKSPEDTVVSRDRHSRLFNALAQLPQEYREAISLRYGNDMTMKEMASVLKVSVSGVKMRVARAHEKLKRIFCAEGEG